MPLTDFSRRSILKLAALTPLAILLRGVGDSEAVLSEPAKVVLAQPADLKALTGDLRIDVVIRRGTDVIQIWTTTPFAGLEVDTQQHPIASDRYQLLGFKFSPKVAADYARRGAS